MGLGGGLCAGDGASRLEAGCALNEVLHFYSCFTFGGGLTFIG